MILMSRSASILIAASVMTIMGLTIAVVAYAAQNGDAPGQTKVTLCHKDKKTITVGSPAADAHLAHHEVDVVGACEESRIGPVEEMTMMTEPTTMMTEPTTSEEEIGEDANLADPATDTTNIEGTNQDDNTSAGTDNEDDDLYGDSSANKLLGRHGNDYLEGGQGPDRMVGGKQGDYINGADGKPGDVINGGIGADFCVGDVGDKFENCDGNVAKVPVPPESAAPAEAVN
jgi:Ca2+-binding RTX toxin-like protein